MSRETFREEKQPQLFVIIIGLWGMIFLAGAIKQLQMIWNALFQIFFGKTFVYGIFCFRGENFQLLLRKVLSSLRVNIVHGKGDSKKKEIIKFFEFGLKVICFGDFKIFYTSPRDCLWKTFFCWFRQDVLEFFLSAGPLVQNDL